MMVKMGTSNCQTKSYGFPHVKQHNFINFSETSHVHTSCKPSFVSPEPAMHKGEKERRYGKNEVTQYALQYTLGGRKLSTCISMSYSQNPFCF